MPTNYDFFAAIWKITTATSGDLSIMEKRTRLADAVERSYTFMKGRAASMKATNPVYVFVGPEYYWLKGVNYALYSAEEKTAIYDHIRQISAGRKKVVLFPGTVSFMVPNKDHGGTLPGKGRQSVGYNSCPVHQGGELLLDYYKKMNDGNVDQRKEASFSSHPMHEKQDFSTGGLRYGLDICGDINQGQLSKTLGGERLDVMVLTSGTVNHNFTDTDIVKYPVHDGGAFIHCDSTGTKTKNGLWALSRGRGAHGSSRTEVTHSFKDMDNVDRTISFSEESKNIVDNKVKVHTLIGFGSLRELTGRVSDKSPNFIRSLSLTFSGVGGEQTALLERSNEQGVQGHWKTTLTRKGTKTPVVVPLKPTEKSDLLGLRFTGSGNVTRISKLFGSPGGDDLDCYYMSMLK